MWLLLLVLVAIGAVVAYDVTQRQHTILHNFPVIGHLRYWLESIGPELRQYIVTNNDEERPFSRDQRRWIYSAAKGAVASLVRSLADRLAHDGIRINTISPGGIHTPLFDIGGEENARAFADRALLGRIGEPAEIGRVVRFLMSDEASYITAAEIIVDGGTISSQR